MSDTLQEFVRSKAKPTNDTEETLIDWNARKDTWIAAINDLYNDIKSWLKPLEDDNSVRYLVAEIQIEEEHIGSYTVDVLSLLIGKQRIAFHPKGTLIIGADGRVDVRGQRAVRTLVLNDDKWSVVERSPTLTLLPFNKDSFQDLLREVME